MGLEEKRLRQIVSNKIIERYLKSTDYIVKDLPRVLNNSFFFFFCLKKILFSSKVFWGKYFFLFYLLYD